MGKKKLTLSIRKDLIEEVKKLMAGGGESLSSVVEEYFEYLVSAEWIDALAKDLGFEGLEPTTFSEIPESRPRGLEAAKVVRELRNERAERISHDSE